MKTPFSYCLTLFQDPGQNRSRNLSAQPRRKSAHSTPDPQWGTVPPTYLLCCNDMTNQAAHTESKAPLSCKPKHSLLLSQNEAGCFRSAPAGSEGNSRLPAEQDEAAQTLYQAL